MQILTSSLYLLSSVAGFCSAWSSGLTVTASTGSYTGTLHPNYTDVRQFLNIPYGLSTAGSNRWMPPVPVPKSQKSFDATKYPPSCPQFVSKVPAVWNQVVTEYLIYDGTESTTAGLFAYSTSEDCLSLAVWTPANVQPSAGLPVIVFMTGGGFVTGGIEITYQIPGRWVHRSQSHIVVTTNYRLNVMGFPNAAGAESQNLGLLDQRAALEWVRDNIRSFGGDPEKIILWGQSAGAMATDYQNFAFWDDPIARGFFMQSGTVFLKPAIEDASHSNFSFVAQQLGCNFPGDGAAEIDCMRKIPVDVIENYVGQYQDNSTLTSPNQSPLNFNPVADEQVVFSNYTERYLEGKVSQVPAIVSNTAYEYSSLTTYPIDNLTVGPNVANTVAQTLEAFICPSANTSVMRKAAGLTTFRYQFAGNFSNLAVFPWMGAYHASDLSMNFGTYEDARGAGTPLEAQTSATMEDFILEFIKNPISGPQSMGWIPYDPSAADGGTMLRFGADGLAVQNVTGLAVDGACYGKGPYDYNP